MNGHEFAAASDFLDELVDGGEGLYSEDAARRVIEAAEITRAPAFTLARALLRGFSSRSDKSGEEVVQGQTPDGRNVTYVYRPRRHHKPLALTQIGKHVIVNGRYPFGLGNSLIILPRHFATTFDRSWMQDAVFLSYAVKKKRGIAQIKTIGTFRFGGKPGRPYFIQLPRISNKHVGPWGMRRPRG